MHTTPITRAAAIVALAVLSGIGCAQEATNASLADVDPVTVEDTATDWEPAPRPEPTTTTTAPPRQPTVADFTLTFTETSRQCFGSAGCLVEGFPVIGWDVALDDDGCTLTYTVNESESTMTESVSLTGGGEYEYFDLYVSTAVDVPITLTAAQVVCR